MNASTIRTAVAIVGTAVVAYSFGRIHGNNFMHDVYRKGFRAKFQEGLEEASREYEEVCAELGKLHSKTGEYADLDEAAYAQKNDELIRTQNSKRELMSSYQNLIDSFQNAA